MHALWVVTAIALAGLCLCAPAHARSSRNCNRTIGAPPCASARPRPAGSPLETHEGQHALQTYRAAVEKARSHQHVWKRRPRSYKALFLTTFLDYTIQMDRYYYDLVEAAARHPSTKVVVWGPGFPGWNENATVGENVHQRYDCDFSFLYFHNGNRGLRVGNRTNIAPCEGRMTVIEEMHDCHKYWCKTGIYETGLASDIVIARYGFIPLELFDKNDPSSPTYNSNSTVKLLAHNPDCADHKKVKPKIFQHKTRKAVLIGSTEPSLYPLRHKIREGINKSLITSIEHFTHPGYFFNVSAYPKENYSEKSQISKMALAQYKIYTEAISSAYMCVFDASVVKKTIKKFMEAMLAGCVVASDVPMDMLGAMHDLIVPLDRRMSLVRIDKIVRSRLDDELRLLDYAARGIRYALRHFTCEAKYERLLDIYESYLGGLHGYHFPYGFKAGCGHTYQGKLNPNWWCQKVPAGPGFLRSQQPLLRRLV